ncbi:uncharacterized protein LOC110048191 [Orbicella faveolata]|uniref:uncharacterized protein LOC110048191 n=1 Tax=Orbicella faveolata TaxID=48498 RepID=UPI0009E6137B|nr:uncharacterized protein LOC110048191 [Orbicella faveolata]
MAEERDDKKRGRAWEKEETIILLEKWGEENIQQRLKECTRKKPIWQEISTYLNASGYNDRDCDSCKTRIHTLISAYRGYEDALSRSSNATPKKKAPFFDEIDEIDEILSDKPATRPAIALSSTVLESTQSKETELTDGEKSPQPSCSFPTLEKQKRKKADEKHLPSLLGRFVVVSMLMRKCYVVCHLTNLLCN